MLTTVTRSGACLVVSPADPGEWAEIAARDPDALVSQGPDWTAAAVACGPWHDASRRYELPDGRRAVLPLLRRRGLPARNAPLSAFPEGWGFGGLVAEGGVRSADLEVVAADLAALGAVRITLSPNPLHAARWAAAVPPGTVSVPRRAHVLDLASGEEALWANLSSRVRTNVRKGQRSVTVESGTSDDLVDAFMQLVRLSEVRWAARQHEPLWLSRLRRRAETASRWRRVFAHLDGRGQVWIARADGRPAAGAIVLADANAHYCRGAMDRDVSAPTCATYALQWSIISDALAQGCRTYHMGESGTSESLSFFKERFGARPLDHATLHLERLPLTAADARVRGAVKSVVRFRDP